MRKLFLLIAVFFGCFKIGNTQPGTLDFSFGKNGVVETDSGSVITYSSMILQKDGKIVAGGNIWNNDNYDFILARYDTNGVLDKSFDLDGYQIIDFSNSNDYINSIAIQNDGRIVAAGYTENNSRTKFAIARVNSDGSLDPTFNYIGKATTNFNDSCDIAYTVAIQKDNKIVVAGNTFLSSSSSDLATVRYNPNGSLDTEFSEDGLVTTHFDNNAESIAKSIFIQSNGQMIIGGISISDFYLVYARYNINGSLDKTFGQEGKQLDEIEFYPSSFAMALQKDEKFLVTGMGSYYDLGEHTPRGAFSIFRHNIDGSFDSTFLLNNTTFTVNDHRGSLNSMGLQNDGKIVIAGSLNQRFHLRRFNSIGTEDTSFETPLSPGTKIKGVSITGNKLYAVGYAQYPGTLGEIARYRLTDNKPPTVTLTSPANNSKYTAPATITLNATAMDKDGTISVVKFYNGGTLLGTDSTSPYSYTLTNPAAGTYSFVAKATDNNGGRSSSASVAVVVSAPINKAPVVSITSPANNTVYTAPATFAINATASDSDGTVSRVRFYSGGTLLATDSTSPYSYTLSNLSAGNYSFVVKATDNNGLTSSSSSVAVAVSSSSNKAPSVSITSPAPNAVYTAPASITINASASDPNAAGSIVSVKFYSGATLLTTDSTAPYTYTLTNAATGTYSVTAKATDNTGSFSSSASVTFNVTDAPNKAPVVSITSPANNATYNAPATVTINAAATDADGSVRNVQFYSGSTLLKKDSTSPYSYTFSNLAAGTYSVTAKATDNLGLFSSSASAAIIVSAVINKAPVVSITSPDSTLVYTAPATITINALASDEDGTISSVKFYNGTTYLKTVSASPYTYTLSNLTAGNYSFTAKATDNNGAETISAAVTISVKAPNKAPTVRITNPANNAVYTAPATITINALAADADGTISSVKFYNGTTYLKTVSASPYTYTLSNLAAGTYTLTAKATDDLGAQTISAAVTVKVINAAIVANKNYTENEKTTVNDAFGLRLNPNPATNIVNIYTSVLQPNKPVTLSIISVSGIVLKIINISNAATQLDVSSLASGVYTLKIISGDKVLHKQFVKL